MRDRQIRTDTRLRERESKSDGLVRVDEDQQTHEPILRDSDASPVIPLLVVQWMIETREMWTR